MRIRSGECDFDTVEFPCFTGVGITGGSEGEVMDGSGEFLPNQEIRAVLKGVGAVCEAGCEEEISFVKVGAEGHRHLEIGCRVGWNDPADEFVEIVLTVGIGIRLGRGQGVVEPEVLELP